MSLDRTVPRARIRAPRLPLKALLVVAALVTLLAGGWLWFRDSSLVGVTKVRITGATSSERARVVDALELAARNQSTLHVREDALRAMAAQFASVAGIEVHSDFPHAMAIRVLERRPVAALA